MKRRQYRVGQWVRLTNANNVRVKLGSVGEVTGTRGRSWIVYVLFDDRDIPYGCRGDDLELLKGRDKAIALAAIALGVRP